MSGDLGPNCIKQRPRYHKILRGHEDHEISHLDVIVRELFIGHSHFQLLLLYYGCQSLLNSPYETTEQNGVEHAQNADDEPDLALAYLSHSFDEMFAVRFFKFPAALFIAEPLEQRDLGKIDSH